MLTQTASICTLVAFVVSKMHSFWMHWHRHTRSWSAARFLLASDACTNPYVRMHLGEFDNCASAELCVAVRPLYKAIHSVAEEIHVCGENRCAILYMDITDRLVYILPLVMLLAVVLLVKLGRDYRYETACAQYSTYALPRLHDKQHLKNI